ncbi:MAG TPA: LysR family transcriptional regulator [Xanthobacteraceae bacterium]|jgi:DNA-binding transcriptional LysR family regulator
MARQINWEHQIGPRLRLRDLHVLYMVAERGSMAKAAAELGISQPAVSDVIANLEHRLGVRLFDRSPQGVEPTMYGEALVKRSLAAFDELKQGVRDIEFLSDPTSGELRLGCVETLSATLVPQIILRFSALYPRVVVHVDDWTAPAVELPGLRDRKYDLILVRLVKALSDEHWADDLNVECIFTDQLVVATGVHNRWARRRRVDLAELIDEPWILAQPGTWNYAGVAEAFKARGLGVPKASLVSVSVALRTRLLANGPFITALPNSVVQLNRDHYALKALPVELPDRPWPVVIVTLRNRTLSPVVERFIGCAREVAKSMGRGPKAP